MKKLILFHANCYDGFGAAWAAWKRFGDHAEYVPVRYGEPPPQVEECSEVYVLDFFYPRAAIEAMKSRHGRVVIIDHHQSAIDALAGLGDTIFAPDKSAAVLAWEHFFPGDPMPRLLFYVQDYDLWRFELPHSREVSVAIGSYPMEFAVWNGLDPERLAEEGRSLLRLQTEMVRTMCDEARLERIDSHLVPVVNATAHLSEIGEELLRRYTDARFSVSYYDRSDGQRHWSLRSRPDFDVSLIAKKYGGGGHRQAAGFETLLPETSLTPQPGSSISREANPSEDH